jgi:hypothetical protein
MKNLAISMVTVVFSAVALAAPVAAALPDCTPGDHAGDLRVTSDCRVPNGTTIDGNFLGLDGTYVIGGVVTGNAKVKRGDLSIAGHVMGKAIQRDGGGITIWGSRARVDGKVVEHGFGDLRARLGASVGGNFHEYGWGMLKVSEATIEGNVRSDPEPPHPDPEPGKSFCQIEEAAVVLGKLQWACRAGFYDA